MKETTKRRVSAESLAVIILTVLAAPRAIPTTQKLLGNNSGFLRNLGFLSGPSATPWAWILALAIAAAYIAFAVRNVPPVART